MSCQPSQALSACLPVAHSSSSPPPSFSDNHRSPLEGLGHCSQPPVGLARSPCPGSSLLCLSHNSQGQAVPGAGLRTALRTHPTTSILLLHPTPPSRAGEQATGTPEVKGGPSHRPKCGDSVAACRTALASLAALVNGNQARWGWLLPEAHTRPSVIKAISHLPTEELQAVAATAGIAWSLVLGGGGTSGQRWGLKSKDCLRSGFR